MNSSRKSIHASCNTKRVNISLVGANGKMGKALHELISNDPQFDLKDAESADLFLDFSSPEGTAYALELAFSFGKPLVSGTTGLQQHHFERMRQAAQKIAILHSPNFSVGIAALYSFLENLRSFPDASFEIRETHHVHKKDAPSGTALKMQQILGKAPITSVRTGEVIGDHEVIVHFAHEELVLKHRVHSRKAFALGALLAVKFILNKAPGLYALQDLILNRMDAHSK